MKDSQSAVDVLMIGTGEYTTGYVHGQASTSDKGPGVVALTVFDLRRRGLVGRCLMAGTQGSKFAGIRKHLQTAIGDRYSGFDLRMDTFPNDEVASDPTAYQAALKQLAPGSAVIIFTPDNSHFEIALAAIQAGCHVLIAKPLVQTLDHHLELIRAARAHGVLVAMEVHKRWDPIYRDARDRIRQLGQMSYFSSYMSQPKSQLETFKHWAGKASDISYYLNAHHIDFNVWAVCHFARPIQVTALGATGVAQSKDMSTEDTISLSTQWQDLETGHSAIAQYTASWIAPKSDVHSQQNFFYLGTEGEIRVDQAHRGYSLAQDASGFRSVNPLFMKYEPDETGQFSGQHAYGYQSIECFLTAVASIQRAETTPDDWNGTLATAQDTPLVTAILEAGRRSLDRGGKPVSIVYDTDGQATGLQS